MTDQALSDPAPKVPATSGHAPSSLLDYLPAIYREDPFLAQFLLAFEKVLLGRQDNVHLPKCDSPPHIAFPDGYDLRLMAVAAADNLVNEGRSLVIVALVGTDLHIRMFDASGKKVVDKAENELLSGETLTALKKQLTPIPDESGLSKEHKQKIIGDATSIAGHTLPDRGLEETIARLPTYCNPKVQALPWLATQAPDEFLPWLAKWTAFSLRAALNADQQRDFIARAIGLYRRRGTKQGMEELLHIFTGARPRIDEDAKRPHHFRVEIDLRLSETDQDKYAEYIRRQKAVTHALIRLEKPAHTTFLGPYLIFSVFTIGKARIGIDTLLSTKPSEVQGHG